MCALIYYFLQEEKSCLKRTDVTLLFYKSLTLTKLTTFIELKKNIQEDGVREK